MCADDQFRNVVRYWLPVGRFLHGFSREPCKKWDFPKIRGTILGVPVIRTMVNWGLYWGSLILGNYQVEGGMSGRRYLGWLNPASP